MIRLFDHRFDAFAGETHQNLPPRAAVAIGAGLVSLLALPWRVCAAWTVAVLSVELWGWFVGRRQHLGQPVARTRQLNFLFNMVILITAWFCLALMLWQTGRVEGAVAGAIIWVSIIGFAQTFGSRTPLGFGVCGIGPAAGVLTVVLSDPRLDWSQRGLVFGIMALALGFAIAGARQTFAAGRRLEEAQTALRTSEAQYRALADNMSDVVGVNDLRAGGWRYISPSIETALGYTPEEFIALTGDDYVHAEDLPVLRAEFAALASTGGPSTLQYRQIRKDGSLIWVETGLNLVRDPATGAPIEVVCESRDVSFRKAMERDLVEARQRAEAAAAAKADFLANMTHELRTPLNAIIGFSGVLRDSQELSSRDARHAHLINEASATLLVVVNDILDFSKLESGAFELDPQPFDPLAIVRTTAMLVEDQAAERGLALEVVGEGELPTLSGDGARLRQVVLNLVSNALKFTAEGGVTVTVSAEPSTSAARRLRVAVADTGIGIAADKLEAVFERFNQADVSVSRKFGGTGLGLAICKRIISLMGGRLGVNSRPGAGSTFWFEVDVPEAAPGALAGERPETATLERPVRLLLVEDVDINRELVRVMLEPFDVEIDTAVNGVEAVEAASRAAYDLILMDVQMPVMDGLAAAAHIRALEHPAARNVPIVAMTANVLPEQVRRCLAAGMDDHIGKPINPAALLEAISRWSAGRNAAAGLAEAG